MRNSLNIREDTIMDADYDEGRYGLTDNEEADLVLNSSIYNSNRN